MKIYTKTGDRGDTGLFGGARVPKCAPRVEAYGEIDEVGAARGHARTEPLPDGIDALLASIQSELFDLGAELATEPGKEDRLLVPPIGDDAITRLERAIDDAVALLPPLSTFVLAGGCRAAAHLHVARTVARRAERRIVALAAIEPVRLEVVRYVNRLSDLLLVLARLANARAGVADVPWIGRQRP
jgi:cob(I)alamin adenosyltransferase